MPCEAFLVGFVNFALNALLRGVCSTMTRFIRGLKLACLQVLKVHRSTMTRYLLRGA